MKQWSFYQRSLQTEQQEKFHLKWAGISTNILAELSDVGEKIKLAIDCS